MKQKHKRNRHISKKASNYQKNTLQPFVAIMRNDTIQVISRGNSWDKNRTEKEVSDPETQALILGYRNASGGYDIQTYGFISEDKDHIANTVYSFCRNKLKMNFDEIRLK